MLCEIFCFDELECPQRKGSIDTTSAAMKALSNDTRESPKDVINLASNETCLWHKLNLVGHR